MTIKNWNAIAGWLVTLLSFVCYLLCLEPSVSLWDCGEFLSAANKLQVVHPPGAPMFLLLARLFALMAPDAGQVALYVNAFSALCSAMTVFFTYHSIVLMVKPYETKTRENNGHGRGLSILAGTVGGLALTFSDTFWFSAVEAEVYALSSFFTAITFWAALKWYYDTTEKADKWLVMIAYLIGLAIGAHLLSLLVIPTISFLYFYKKKKLGWKNMSYAFVIGLGVLFFVQNGVISGVPKLMAFFELLCVNSLGFGFDTGILVFAVLTVSVLAYGLYYFSAVNKKPGVHLAILSLCYLLLGFSSYAMIPVRSRESLPVDMNNPEEPFKLKFYVNREQYEERPLLKGPYFNASAIDYKEGAAEYRKDAKGYTFIGNKQSYIFDPEYNTWFPRMGDMQKSSSPDGYRVWSGMTEVEQEIRYLEQTMGGLSGSKLQEARDRLQELKAQKPTMANNLRYFFDYQLNHMYLRYFLWNFVGRQNDLQGHSYNRLVEGNWISGVPMIDRMRLGPQEGMPEDLKDNKGRNVFFFLPLFMGLAGMFWHYKKDRKMFGATGIFFLFTGILIIVFLNQPPFEPRERDYVHVGSFQIFCIWIGMGCLQVYQWLMKKFNWKLSFALTSVISLSAPAIMAQQGWDDHNRSKRYIALDLARDILDSCPENALFLGNADNDTYPVWYAQNVLGYRTDVRVVNQNLLPTDWYSKQLMTDVYKSKAFAMSLEPKDLDQGVNEYFQWRQTPESEQPVELNAFLKELTSSNEGVFSKHKFFVKVNKQAAANVTYAHWPSEEISDTLYIDFPKRGLHKGDLVLLAILAESAKEGFKRSICFSTIAGDDGYDAYVNYIRKRGMVYELSPIYTPQSGRDIKAINKEVSYDLLMNKFHYGGIKDNPEFYVDDKSQIFPESLRNCFMELSGAYLEEWMSRQNDPGYKDLGKLEKTSKSKAIALMNYCERQLPDDITPASAATLLNMANIWHYAGEEKKAMACLQKSYDRSMIRLKYFKKFLGTSYDSDYAINAVNESLGVAERCRETGKQWTMSLKGRMGDKEFESLKTEVRRLQSYD